MIQPGVGDNGKRVVVHITETLLKKFPPLGAPVTGYHLAEYRNESDSHRGEVLIDFLYRRKQESQSGPYSSARWVLKPSYIISVPATDVEWWDASEWKVLDADSEGWQRVENPCPILTFNPKKTDVGRNVVVKLSPEQAPHYGEGITAGCWWAKCSWPPTEESARVCFMFNDESGIPQTTNPQYVPRESVEWFAPGKWECCRVDRPGFREVQLQRGYLAEGESVDYLKPSEPEAVERQKAVTQIELTPEARERQERDSALIEGDSPAFPTAYYPEQIVGSGLTKLEYIATQFVAGQFAEGNLYLKESQPLPGGKFSGKTVDYDKVAEEAVKAAHAVLKAAARREVE